MKEKQRKHHNAKDHQVGTPARFDWHFIILIEGAAWEVEGVGGKHQRRIEDWQFIIFDNNVNYNFMSVLCASNSSFFSLEAAA